MLFIRGKCFIIEDNHDTEEDSYTSIIKLGPSYPKTEFSDLLKEENDSICIRIQSKEGENTEDIEFPLFSTTIYIEEFYSSIHGEFAEKTSSLDKSLFRGLGKILLCYHIQNSPIDSDIVQLTASHSREDIQTFAYTYNEKYSDKQILQIIQDEFPEIIKQTTNLNYSQIDYRNILAEAQSNYLLVEYYEQTYGFKMLNSPTTAVSMGTTKTKLLLYCK